MSGSNPCRILWTGVLGQETQSIADPPGGVVLFGRDLDPDPATGPPRCHALLRDLQERWNDGSTLAVAIDQEGGPVSRLKVWVGETPSMRRIWTASGAPGCEAWGRLWGEGLRRLGFNVDFAPVADLHGGTADSPLGQRCASEDPEEAASAAGAFLHGMESLGIKGCLKHFPGLGGTRLDSHVGLPELTDPAQVEKGLAAFRRLAHPDRLVMVAHVRTPWSGDLPASLHRGHAAGNPWGVQGRWITDDLEMGGVAAWPWVERIPLALAAGHQALLVCQFRGSIEEVRKILQGLPETAWRGALDAFTSFRRSLPLPDPAPFDPDGWSDWVRRVQAAAAELG